MIQSATNDHVLELVVLGSDILQKPWPAAGVGCQPHRPRCCAGGGTSQGLTTFWRSPILAISRDPGQKAPVLLILTSARSMREYTTCMCVCVQKRVYIYVYIYIYHYTYQFN